MMVNNGTTNSWPFFDQYGIGCTKFSETKSEIRISEAGMMRLTTYTCTDRFQSMANKDMFFQQNKA